MKYQQLTSEERVVLSTLKLQGLGLSMQKIAEQMGRHRSTWTHLRQSPKVRRKRYKAYDSRGRLADKRHITERPKTVETRHYKGHWEIDTVMGKGSTDCIVTLLERKTGFLMIGKLQD